MAQLRRTIDLAELAALCAADLTIKQLCKHFRCGFRVVKRSLSVANISKTKSARPNSRQHSYQHMLGQKYHHLRVTAFVLEKHNWHAVAECDCGNTIHEIPLKLTKGLRKTCGIVGCPHFHRLRQDHGKKAGFTGYEEIYGCRWAAWRIGAEKRGIPFEVTLEEAWAKYLAQSRRCALTGVPISFGNSWNRKFTASLDRIDSTRAYTADNIQWVHKRLNVMKGNMTDDEFKFWCRAVTDFEANAIPLDAQTLAPYEQPVRGAANWKKGCSRGRRKLLR